MERVASPQIFRTIFLSYDGSMVATFTTLAQLQVSLLSLGIS